jgi:hypothetical protein
MPNWAQLLARLAADAKKPIAEGLSSVEGVLTPERIAQIQQELAKMRLLRRRGDALGSRIAGTPIEGAQKAGAWPEGILGGGAGVATVGALSEPEEAEAAINPAEALSATRALDRQAIEVLIAKMLAKAKGEAPLSADAAMNASRAVSSSIHGRPSNAKATWDLMKEYAEKMGTGTFKTTETVAPGENVFSGPKVLGHFNYEKGGVTTPLNYQSATHEISGHGMTSDLAQKLNIPGRVRSEEQTSDVRQMLEDLLPGRNADDLRARIMGNLSSAKDPMEIASGFRRSGVDEVGSEFVAHAQSWKEVKNLHGSVEAADAVFDKIPLVQKIEAMATKDPAVMKAWNAYKGIAKTREARKAGLKQGAKATIPALGAGAGVSALQAQDDYGFVPDKPAAQAAPKEDYGFVPDKPAEDFGFVPDSGEMTAQVGEPSQETQEQLLGALTEEGIPPEIPGVGTKKFGTPEGIGRIRSGGEQGKDLLTRLARLIAYPGSENPMVLLDALKVPENLARTTIPLTQDQPGWSWDILKTQEGRPSTGNENADLIADILGTSIPVGKGAKYLLKLAQEAKAGKAATVLEKAGSKAGRNLEQMFADTREAAAGSRFIPGTATPAMRKFSREEIEQALAKAQEAKGGLKITDSRAFPPAARPDMPGGPARMKLGEVYEGLNEGWNDASNAARRAIGPEVAKTAQKVEDLSAISALGQKGEPKEAKWWKAIGAKYIRSLDNWLMENGGQSVVEPIKKAVYAGDAWRSEWAHKADGILKGIKEGSKEATIIGKYLNGDIKAFGLTPELQLRGDRIRTEILEPVIAQVRNDPELKGLLGEIGYIKDYFPQMEKVWASRYGTENALALIHDVKPAAFKARFFKKRRSLAKDPLEDIVTVTRAYLRGSAKTLFDIKGYNSAVKAMKELPAGPGNLFEEAASKYAKTFIGQPSTRSDIGAAEKAMNAVHDWYYKAYIGFNPISAGLNLTQTANTFVATGAKYTLQGMKDVFKATPEAKALAKKFMDSGVMTEFRGMEISPSLEKSKGKMDEALFYLFGKAEKLNRKIAFNAGYREGIAKGFSEEKALRHALDVVHRTQFTYGKASSVGYAGVPLVGQFSNYPLKQLEFILGSIKDPASRKRAFAMILMSAAAAPTPLGNTILEQASNLAPGLGPGGKDLLVLPGQAIYQGKLPSAYDIGRRIPFVSGVLRTGKAAIDTTKWLENVGRGLAPEKK